MRKKRSVFLLLLFYSSAIIASNNVFVRLSLANGILKITPYTDKIVRVQYAANAKALNRYSLVVVMAPQQNHFLLHDRGKQLVLKNSFGSLAIDKESGHLEFKNCDEINLIQDRNHNAKRVIVDDSLNQLSFLVANYFSVDTMQQLYGLDFQNDQVIELTDQEMSLNKKGEQMVRPILLSNANYGIFWDNFCDTKLGVSSADGAYFISEKAKCLDYYFILGNCMEDVLNGYKQLIGEVGFTPDD